MELNDYLKWRENNFISSVSNNFGRKQFLITNWNDFNELFFKQTDSISDINFKEWITQQNSKIKEWFIKNPIIVKKYYIECKICELIRNKKYVSSIIQKAELRKIELISKPTKAEIQFKNYLENKKIPFKFQEIIYIKDEFGIIYNYYIADFVIGNTVIEVDGGYHLKRKQIVKDSLRTKQIEKMGYRVVRIKNEDVNNISI